MSRIVIYANIGAMIDAFLKKINAGLRYILKDANRRYRLGLISDALLENSQEFVLREGKRIRPLLFILGYKGYAQKKHAPDNGLFKSAAAIELLHDFMLIHDDVIDKSDLRRGKPTLHKLFDKKIKLADDARIGPELAIVAGDIIFALAIEALLSIQEDKARKEMALKKLVETAAYTGAGEFIDVAYSHKNIDQLSLKMIFLTYTLKTAKYTFECPLLMGAILAGAGPGELKKISRLGLAAGQAFQIYDDFLDLFSSQKIIGKPILTDLAESKKTLLVFQAYHRLKGKEKKEFKRILEKKDKKPADLENFRKLITKSGSYDASLKQMCDLQKSAIQSCGSLKMKKIYKRALESIIEKLSPQDQAIAFKKSI